jgi:hypothetical protein
MAAISMATEAEHILFVNERFDFNVLAMEWHASIESRWLNVCYLFATVVRRSIVPIHEEIAARCTFCNGGLDHGSMKFSAFSHGLHMIANFNLRLVQWPDVGGHLGGIIAIPIFPINHVSVSR